MNQLEVEDAEDEQEELVEEYNLKELYYSQQEDEYNVSCELKESLVNHT